MIAYSRILILLTAAALLAGCSKQTDSSRVKFETSKGDFVVQVHKDWAPLGAERFIDLAKSGFYDNARFFRVVTGFMVQFGIAGDPNVQSKWREATIQDDPVKESNIRGKLSFAKKPTPGSRTSQVFINLVDNSRLDASGFAPFAEVVSGMEVVDQLYSGYGDGAPSGAGPSQDIIQTQGNAYLEKDFPRLDFIKKASME
jgi:peptidyl-prolyl cis-trans isomerase A (cyclophilin A)